jgi:hypothetical protein
MARTVNEIGLNRSIGIRLRLAPPLLNADGFKSIYAASYSSYYDAADVRVTRQ